MGRYLVALLVGVALAARADDDPTGCLDPVPWQKLEALRDRQDDAGARDAMQFLLNYRRFLCAETLAGRLPVSEAGRLFEDQRDRILDEASLIPNAPPSL